MKQLFFTLIIGLLSIHYLIAQDVGIRPKFISGELTRVAIALGADFGSLNPEGSDVADNIENGSPANLTIDLGLDIYSPKSILGLYTGVGIDFKNYAVNFPNSQARDSISSTYLEIPLYAKFRFGNQNSKTHFWVAGGGGYAFPLKFERETITNSGTLVPIDDNKGQAKSLPFIGGLVGVEFIIPFGKTKEGEEIFDRDDFRILLYGGYQKDLGQRLNPDGFNTNNSVLGAYNSPDLSFSSIKFGLKVFYRFTKAGELLKDKIL